MAVAARVKPKDFFTDEEWAPLAARSNWFGLWLVAHAWLTIAAAAALFIVFPNPLTFVLAVMVIGARQLGLAILMHEAAHGCVHPNIKINDFVGQWLCGAPTNGDLLRYRDYHLQHHKFAQQAEDPDLSLSAPFPTTRASLWRKVVRDLTGQTFYKQRIQPSLDAFKAGKAKGIPFGKTLKGVLGFWKPLLVFHIPIIIVITAVGYWWVWPVLWLIPMATWYPLVTRLRNIAEHALVGENQPDPLRHARTTIANPLERLLIAPYYVNYHGEHHMFMHVPCWNLPRAHRLLRQKGVTQRMLVAKGYLGVLKAASSKGLAAA